MKTFHVQLSFINKKSETKKVDSTDNVTALTHTLNGLSLTEKDNVIGVKVAHIGQEKVTEKKEPIKPVTSSLRTGV